MACVALGNRLDGFFFSVHLFNNIRFVCSNCFESLHQSLSFCVIILLASCLLASFLALFFPAFLFSSFPLSLYLCTWFGNFQNLSFLRWLLLPTSACFWCHNLAKPLLWRLTIYIFNTFFSTLHMDQFMSTHKWSAVRCMHTYLQSPGKHVSWNISNMFNQHCSQGSSEEQKLKVSKWAVNSAMQNSPKEYKM